MSERKLGGALSTIQWTGFGASAAVSMLFLFVDVRPMESVTGGILLATLTQLVELQMRLNQAMPFIGLLHHGKYILEPIEEILESYNEIVREGFKDFQVEAEGTLKRCRDKLHEMANEHSLTTSPRPEAPYEPSLRAVRAATRSIKAVDSGDLSHWHTPAARDYLLANASAIATNKIKIERVFIAKRQVLRRYKSVLEEHRTEGVQVFAVPERNVPHQLIGDYLIMDDRALIWVELNPDGTPRERRTNINPDRVARKLDDFEKLKKYAVRLDEV